MTEQLLREWPPCYGGVERVAHELAAVWGGVVWSFDAQGFSAVEADALPSPIRAGVFLARHPWHGFGFHGPRQRSGSSCARRSPCMAIFPLQGCCWFWPWSGCFGPVAGYRRTGTFFLKRVLDSAV